MQRQRSALESHHLHQIERSSGSSISSSGLLPGANPGAQPPPPPQSLIPPEILRNRDIAKIPSTALPPAIVTVGGQTLIAPNSKLARAIVMGNDVSSAASETNGICIGRQEEVPVQSSNARSSPSRGVDSRPSAGALSSPNRQNLVEYVRPMSNLSVLLNQQQQQHHRGGAEVGEERHSPLSDRPSGLLHRHRALSSSSSSISQNNNNNYVDEADSASGPAPALSQFTMQLGRSAPNVGQTAGSANFLLRPPPPPPPLAQVGGQNANFETVSSTDNVRR